jgi:hypothetical protein
LYDTIKFLIKELSLDAQGSGKAERDINIKANASVRRDITNTDLTEEQGHDFGSRVRPDENTD